MSNLNPRIYVVCRASCKADHEYGAWIDANQSADDLKAAIKRALANSPVPRKYGWLIKDFEDFGAIQIEKKASLDEVSELAKFVEEHGELGAQILVDTLCMDISEAKRVLTEDYQGPYDSKEDFARYMVDEVQCLGEIAPRLLPYIDYEYLARDLFIDSYFAVELRGETHVFNYC